MTTQTTEAATPETEAKASPHIGFYSCATVPAEFARQLERERDEAREALAEEIRFHHRTHSELVQTQCQMQDLIREREAASEGAK